MSGMMGGVMLPTPSPSPSPASEVLGLPLDIADLIVGAFGAVGTVVLALAAVWISVRAGRETKMNEQRRERSDWMLLYAAFLNGWVRHWSSSSALRSEHARWDLDYDLLKARARVLTPGTATVLVDAAMTAHRYIIQKYKPKELGRRHDLAEDVRSYLLDVAQAWVDKPKKVDLESASAGVVDVINTAPSQMKPRTDE